jgi:hypothetical protein
VLGRQAPDPGGAIPEHHHRRQDRQGRDARVARVVAGAGSQPTTSSAPLGVVGRDGTL